jgi:hypothetical protein
MSEHWCPIAASHGEGLSTSVLPSRAAADLYAVRTIWDVPNDLCWTAFGDAEEDVFDNASDFARDNVIAAARANPSCMATPSYGSTRARKIPTSTPPTRCSPTPCTSAARVARRPWQRILERALERRPRFPRPGASDLPVAPAKPPDRRRRPAPVPTALQVSRPSRQLPRSSPAARRSIAPAPCPAIRRPQVSPVCPPSQPVRSCGARPAARVPVSADGGRASGSAC